MLKMVRLFYYGFDDQDQFVQRLDNAIHRINRYPVDSVCLILKTTKIVMLEPVLSHLNDTKGLLPFLSLKKRLIAFSKNPL